MANLFTKQANESKTVGIDFTNRLPTGVTINSRLVYACQLDPTESLLTSPLAIDDTVMTTLNNVGNGAVVTLNPGAANEERVLVQTSVGNPATNTLGTSISKVHVAGEPILYYPGVTSEIIDITNPLSGNIVQIKLRRGAEGERYNIVVMTTLSNGDQVEDDIIMQVLDA